LQQDGPEQVAEDEGEDEAGPDAALGDELRRDVADGEEEPACNPGGHRGPHQRTTQEQDEDGSCGARAEPDEDQGRRPVAARTAPADEGHREREQSQDGKDHPGQLAPAELAAAHARRHVREHADAAGVDALYE
jgi:hypothetical protein